MPAKWMTMVRWIAAAAWLALLMAVGPGCFSAQEQINLIQIQTNETMQDPATVSLMASRTATDYDWNNDHPAAKPGAPPAPSSGAGTPVTETQSTDTQAGGVPYRESKGADSCGLTCVDMILAYHHITLPEADLAPLREKAAQENGVTVNDIVALLQKAGFKTLRHQGHLAWPGAAAPGEFWFKDIDNPLSQIHFKRPVILHVKLDAGTEHFVLLVGYNEPQQKYVLLNPGVGPVVVPAAALEKIWADGEHVFIAYKPPDSAVPATPPPAP